MVFDYRDMVLSHQIIAESHGIKIHYAENTLKGIIAAMNQSFGGKDLHPDIYEKAAILFEHIIRLHPFMDGNKRTAMFSMKVYLKSKGIIFISFPSDVRFTVSVAENCNSRQQEIASLTGNIRRWIGFHCAPEIDRYEIERIITRNIRILENVKYISTARNKKDILSRSVNYWLKEGVYPDINVHYEDLINDFNMLQKFANIF